jgi:hypothetical protein
MYSDHYKLDKLDTSRFDYWSSDEEVVQRYMLTPELGLPTSQAGWARDH